MREMALRSKLAVTTSEMSAQGCFVFSTVIRRHGHHLTLLHLIRLIVIVESLLLLIIVILLLMMIMVMMIVIVIPIVVLLMLLLLLRLLLLLELTVLKRIRFLMN